MTAHYSLTKTAAPPRTISKPCISEPTQVYLEIRKSTALACALDTMAQKALDEGEFPTDQLDHLGALTQRLLNDLEELKHLLAIAGTGGHHE